MTRVRALSGRTFRSLRIRNYRLFFVGQLVSMTGTWLQAVAQAWLVLRLTHSGFAVGLVTALQFLPVLVAGVWGGVVADRVDKRRALLVTQSGMALVALVLAAVTAAGVVELWMVYLAAFLLGCATVVDNPTRQAFVTEMVGRDELPNAIGLNSAMFNAARVFGPAAAGLLIAGVGIWPCFALNALSFVAVIGGLRAMRTEELHPFERAPRERGQVRAGLRYAWGNAEVRATLALVAIVGTFGLNFAVTLPLLARFTFDRGAETFGLMSSAMGLGSLAGALATAARARPTRRLLVNACAGFGVATLGVAAAPTLPMVLGLLPLVGVAYITFMATANSTLQLRSDGAMRGRVMALYSLLFLGTTPLGGPLVGWVAESFGARAGLALGGGTALLAAGVAAAVQRRVDSRPVPPVALPEATVAATAAPAAA